MVRSSMLRRLLPIVGALSLLLPLSGFATTPPIKELELHWDELEWNTSETAWEVHPDGAGNNYVVTATNQHHLIKIDSAGNELWKRDNPFSFTPTDMLQRSFLHLDSIGNLYWVIQSGSEFGKVMKFSPDGDLLFTIPGRGRTQGTCNGKPISRELAKLQLDGEGNIVVFNSKGQVTKYDGQSGTLIWQGEENGHYPIGYSCGIDFTFDGANNIYLTGMGMKVDYNYTAITMKVDGVSGQRLWWQSFYHPQSDAAPYVMGQQIDIDSRGNLLVNVTGTSNGLISYNLDGTLLAATPADSFGLYVRDGYQFDPVTDTLTLALHSSEGNGLNVVKYQWDGNSVTEKWRKSYAPFNNATGTTSVTTGTSIDTDRHGNTLVAGSYRDGTGASSVRPIMASFDGIGALNWSFEVHGWNGGAQVIRSTGEGEFMVGGGTVFPHAAFVQRYRDGAAPIPDSDGDGLDDKVDNCPLVANADQLDTPDADGVGNACDSDDDNDGVVDNLDNCPDMSNPGQLDSDSDGIGDSCDNDNDNDSVPDELDNCSLVANSDQSDSDLDGQGDSCDADDDNDGQVDSIDNCPLIANGDQLDIDMDGQGDACDGDDDADGVADEVDHCPSSPLDRLTDEEGCTGPQRIVYVCGSGEPGDFANHGLYVKCVTHTANELAHSGLLSNQEKGRLAREAAKMR